MRHTARRGLLTVVAAGGALASTAGYAHAAASATGTTADSPGGVSGNSVQAPVEVPVNVCGNTVDVVGLLNPAYGNSCGNHSSSHGSGGSGSTATGGAHGSPGVGSGNGVQAPVDVPVNACGNSVNVVGVGNPAFGNQCANHGHVSPPPTHTPPPTHCGCHPTPPPSHQPPPPSTPSSPGSHTPGGSTSPTAGHTRQAPPPSSSTPAPGTQLASTGGGSDAGMLAAAGLALMGGGALLYRRARTAGRHH
ncbi:chaplin [Streptacidiphilus monticola]|uniref:Chaplin n=1 Tax=Streptacidiphilus monticola TaxID=2161674 RepID=A0ABW1FTZ6_9ACTN